MGYKKKKEKKSVRSLGNVEKKERRMELGEEKNRRKDNAQSNPLLFTQ